MYSCLILATVLAFIKTHLYIRSASTSISIVFFLKKVVLSHKFGLLICFFCEFVIDLLGHEAVSSWYDDWFFIVLLQCLLVCGQFKR